MFDFTQKLNRVQKVLTFDQFNKLVRNHNSQTICNYDPKPVVKFFDPRGAATWLLIDLDPETGIGYAICDLGMGYPEIGILSLDELIAIGYIERDIHFRAEKTGVEYLTEARENGSISV